MPQLSCCNNVKETSYLRDEKTSNKIRGMNGFSLQFKNKEQCTKINQNSQQCSQWVYFSSCQEIWFLYKKMKDAQSKLSIIECHQIVVTMIVLFYFMFFVCCVVRTLRLSHLLYILLSKKSFIFEHLLLHLHL